MIETTIGGTPVRTGNPERGPRDVFVGRRDELTSLVGLLHASSSRTRSATVAGEAGIGKTRLITEFLDWARQSGHRVLQGHCYETQEIEPYFPILQVIDQLRLSPSEPRQLVRDLAGDAPQGRALLAGPQGLLTETQSGRTAFMRALCEAVLSPMQSDETVLCVEDVQWADEGSLLFLNYLLDLQVPGLLVIFTLRPNQTGTGSSRQLLARLEEKSSAVALRGLSALELKELVRTVTTPGEITDDEINALHDFTQGSPLLARELLTVLRESNLLRRYTVTEALRQSQTPSRVSFVLDLRLETLDTQVLGTLAMAATIGANFTEESLAQVIGCDVGRIEDDLALAAARGVVDAIDALDARGYRFSHPLYRMRIYERLSPSERRRLHRDASESLCLSIDEIAYHYAQGFGAQRSKQTVAHCRRAAEEAEAVLAYETAARFWRLALTSTKSNALALRTELYSRLGWALWAASKWQAAVEAWSAATVLLEEAGDWSQFETIALALGETYRLCAQHAEAERWLTRALEVPADSAAHRARALALLASVHSLRRNSATAAPLLEEAAALVRAERSDPIAMFWLSYSFMATGQRAIAYALAKQGLREAQRRGDNGSVAMLAGNLVLQELGQLRFKTARSYGRLVERAVEPGNTAAFQRSMFCRAWLLGYAGEWRVLNDLSIEWIAQIRFASPFQVASARTFLAEAKLWQGDLIGAKEKLHEALPDLDQMAPIAAMSLARLHLLEGDEPAARQIVDRHAGRLLHDRRVSAAAGRAALADVVADIDDEPKLWGTYYKQLAREEWPLLLAYSPVSVQRVLGRLATRLKRWKVAKEHFNTAIAELQKGGATWELGRAYADAAVMLRARRRRGDVDKAAALDGQAQTILHGVSVSPGDQSVEASRNDRSQFVLTGRQVEVLALVADGYSNPKIAAELTLSTRTVERHLEDIMRRLSARSRTEAVAKAIGERLLEPPRKQSRLGIL